MYTFSQPLSRIADGKLMVCTSDKKRIEIRQYFQRRGYEDVEFSDPTAFCKYLVDKLYRDGRKIFYKEDIGTYNLKVYSTSPYEVEKSEVFEIGEFIYEG